MPERLHAGDSLVRRFAIMDLGDGDWLVEDLDRGIIAETTTSPLAALADGFADAFQDRRFELRVYLGGMLAVAAYADDQGTVWFHQAIGALLPSVRSPARTQWREIALEDAFSAV